LLKKVESAANFTDVVFTGLKSFLNRSVTGRTGPVTTLVYVPLSRVKCLADLIILRHFDYKVLLIKPNKSQLAEIERLDKLYLETQKRFSEWF
jgi:hypothetical protein